MKRNVITALLMGILMIVGVACGSVAVPEWDTASSEATEPEAETHSEEATESPTIEPTLEPTAIPPTATPQPTAIPPTAVPTEAPTEAVEETDPIAEAVMAGDVTNGAAIFQASYDTSSGAWMCQSCHSIDEAETRLVGPGLYNLYARADEQATASGDADAVSYVRNSIVAPAAYHVPAEPPYPENLMPQNYGELLSEQELTDLVAYVLSLGYDS